MTACREIEGGFWIFEMIKELEDTCDMCDIVQSCNNFVRGFGQLEHPFPFNKLGLKNITEALCTLLTGGKAFFKRVMINLRKCISYAMN